MPNMLAGTEGAGTNTVWSPVLFQLYSAGTKVGLGLGLGCEFFGV